MKIAFWRPYINNYRDDVALHENTMTNIYACNICIYDLKNKEIDLVDSDEYPVSLKLR